jgi:adenylate cyclase
VTRYLPEGLLRLKRLGVALYDQAAQLLWDGAGQSIALRGQSVRVLEALLDAQGALLDKDELISTVWGKTIVGDDSLVQCIKEIRQALGESAFSICFAWAKFNYPRDLQTPRGAVFCDRPSSICRGWAALGD